MILDHNQIIAGESGAIDLVLEIMKTHINNASVCEYGCGALWDIIVNNSNMCPLN